jgi:small-conductance mechanosensitive channel
MDDEILDSEDVLENLVNMVLGNSTAEWTVAILAGLATLLILQIAKIFLLKRLARLIFRRRQKAERVSINLANQTKLVFMVLISIYVGSRFLRMPESLSGLIAITAATAFIIQLGIWAHALIDTIIHNRRGDNLPDEAGSVTTLNVVGLIAKGTVWTVVLLLVLDNIPGIQVTTLIASLGIGGIAIGLAVQNILADLFASLSIALDKPFVIGDFIVVGEYRGSVEHIGLKSTRLRSISGEQLVFGNGDLLGSRIQNFKRMVRRRVVFRVGVTYQTTADQLAAIPVKLREIVEAQENTTFDRAHFQEFGDFSLIFEIVYFVEEPDFTVYMDIQQRINLEIMRYFETAGIEFAYPTQTVLLQSRSLSEEMVRFTPISLLKQTPKGRISLDVESFV